MVKSTGIKRHHRDEEEEAEKEEKKLNSNKPKRNDTRNMCNDSNAMYLLFSVER